MGTTAAEAIRADELSKGPLNQKQVRARYGLTSQALLADALDLSERRLRIAPEFQDCLGGVPHAGLIEYKIDVLPQAARE